MEPLYTVDEIRAIERAAFARRPSFSFMERAGRAVAAQAAKMIPPGAAVVVVAGGGNNGGDAFVAAVALRRAGFPVRLLFAAAAGTPSPDSQKAAAMWRAAGGETEEPSANAFAGAALIIDGLFGVGLSRPVDGWRRKLIERINSSAAKRLSIDVPSGLCADKGTVLGIAVCADATITFFGGKPGLYTGAGRDYAGVVVVHQLGEKLRGGGGLLLTEMPQPEHLTRRQNTHKGDYGTLALVGGQPGMLGALVLAARAAATLGAGKVRALAMENPPPVDWTHPEIMWGDAKKPFAADCVAAGMGMGVSAAARAVLLRVLAMPVPVLLDADALNLLARFASCRRVALARTAVTILTPHPGEAARLLGVDAIGTRATAVNADRLTAAKKLAADWGATVVLKGAGTIVSSPDGNWAICAAGNPGLARGGSGDVLSGIIAALLAQTSDAEFAARAGVFLHAKAADDCAARHGVLGLNINHLPAAAAAIAEKNRRK